ncbi:MAG TPA: hypothetical protein VHA11_08905 [Bryobacteraceae bacterium]|nr:hypothetical protein [Bryobacteraceae bacterium]
MRQALHIFLKDVRLLWAEVLASLAVAAVFTATLSRGAGSGSSYPATGNVASELLTYLLPLTWFTLIARAIYNEALPGDRQFWVTRPYDWRSLLLAKALFIAAFVNLPKLVSDAVIIHAYGFGIAPETAGLLWNQLLLTAAFVLPLAAICTVTSGLTQLLSVTFLLGLAAVAWNLVIPELSSGASWLRLEWVRTYSAGIVAALAAAFIILLQYRRRATLASRWLAAAAALLVLAAVAWLPWRAAFALQSRFAAQQAAGAGVRLVCDADSRSAVRVLFDGSDVMELRIPLRITGASQTLLSRVDGIAATIEGPQGTTRWKGRQPWSQVLSDDTSTWFRARLEGPVYRRLRDVPVRIRGTVYLTLYGNERRTFVPRRTEGMLHDTPGMGLCSFTQAGTTCLLNCRSAFRPRPDLVSIEFAGNEGQGNLVGFRNLFESRNASESYAPFPAEPEMVPVTLSTWHSDVRRPVSGAMVRAIEPVAHIRRDFEVTGLRLAEHEVR